MRSWLTDVSAVAPGSASRKSLGVPANTVIGGLRDSDLCESAMPLGKS